jgi:hypothetical protein
MVPQGSRHATVNSLIVEVSNSHLTTTSPMPIAMRTTEKPWRSKTSKKGEYRSRSTEKRARTGHRQIPDEKNDIEVKSGPVSYKHGDPKTQTINDNRSKDQCPGGTTPPKVVFASLLCFSDFDLRWMIF